MKLAEEFNRAARLWDVESGLPVGPTRHHGSAIRSLAFDPLGGKFVTGGADGQAYFWPVGRDKVEARHPDTLGTRIRVK